MLIELDFLKCKKTHQNPKYLMSNIGLLNLDDKFYNILQNSWIHGLLSYNMSILLFETLGYLINYILKTKNALNEWNVILIYYVMNFSKSQKL